MTVTDELIIKVPNEKTSKNPDELTIPAPDETTSKVPDDLAIKNS